MTPWKPVIMDKDYPLAKTGDDSNIQIDEENKEQNQVHEITIMVRDNETNEPIYIYNFKNIWTNEETHNVEIYVNDMMEWSSN